VAVYRLIVGVRGHPKVFTIYNLETDGTQVLNLDTLASHFIDSVVEERVTELPPGDFLEVMYHNGVIDPAQESILMACSSLGAPVIAAKVSKRYYSDARDDVYFNRMVHVKFTNEPRLDALRPRGKRKGMELFDLSAMSDNELIALGNGTHPRRLGCDLALSLEAMKKLREFQKRLDLPYVTDVFLETFGARWSDHCNHIKWKALGLFKILKDATKRIRNSNLVSAFVDNAGVWKFFENLVIAIKLETHCSPSQQEPYGGQLTKLGGVIRDIFFCGLGFRAILNLELTVVGEFTRKKYKQLEGITLSARRIAYETIRAIADYGNPMGIPMGLARMLSHPSFSGKVFALGGTIGVGREDCALQGTPQKGDWILMVGGRTGNDGLHGATVSSGQMTEQTDSGDACHVQIGNPFPEQKMGVANEELRDAGCVRRGNDFGAAGIVSALAEMGEHACDGIGGILINLALVLLKCAGLENWEIGLSESQERGGYIIVRDKLDEAIAILERYQLEYAIVGTVTGSGRFQMIYDPEATELDTDMPLTGEICIDVPYSFFDECPLPTLEIIEPPARTEEVNFPEITPDNVEEMVARVTGHFDVCDQSWATTQYDSTVQGHCVQGPLCGCDHNVTSHLAVCRPAYGKPYAMTVSQSFSPWQFEVDPHLAARNAMLDAIVTQIISGVKRTDVCLADNFYTPSEDPYAYYWLTKQVQEIADLSELTETPFISGKDSSSGTGFGVNVVPSVVITAMGKHPDYRKLILHQWRQAGNIIIAVGPQHSNLSGSILASSLGLTGTTLGSMPTEKIHQYLDRLHELAVSGLVVSAVPINRGGIALRLFEGIMASEFGINVPVVSSHLFAENYGTALLEVSPDVFERVSKCFPDLTPWIVGFITDKREFRICGRTMDLDRLKQGWETTFVKEVA
jgi:phosphoribosylformylglycinamidine (FGAM) synthase-like enzyme